MDAIELPLYVLNLGEYYLCNGIIIDFFHLLSPLKLPEKVEDELWQSRESYWPVEQYAQTLIMGVSDLGYLFCEKTKIQPVTTHWAPSLLRPGTKIKLSSSFTVKMEFPFIESINPLHNIFTLVSPWG